MWASEDNSGYIVSWISGLSCGIDLFNSCVLFFPLVITHSKLISFVQSRTCQKRSRASSSSFISLARNNATDQIAALRMTEKEAEVVRGGPDRRKVRQPIPLSSDRQMSPRPAWPAADQGRGTGGCWNEETWDLLREGELVIWCPATRAERDAEWAEGERQARRSVTKAWSDGAAVEGEEEGEGEQPVRTCWSRRQHFLKSTIFRNIFFKEKNTENNWRHCSTRVRPCVVLWIYFPGGRRGRPGSQ